MNSGTACEDWVRRVIEQSEEAGFSSYCDWDAGAVAACNSDGKKVFAALEKAPDTWIVRWDADTFELTT